MWLFGRETRLITLHFKPIFEINKNSTFKHSQVGKGIPLWDSSVGSSESLSSDKLVTDKKSLFIVSTQDRHIVFFFFIVFILLPSLSCHWNRAAEQTQLLWTVWQDFKRHLKGTETWKIISQVLEEKNCSGLMKVYCSGARMWLFSASHCLTCSR